MNKKMREIKQKMKLKLDAVKALNSDTQAEEIAVILDEMDELEKAYALEERVYAQEKALAGESFDEPPSSGEEKATGFGTLAKLFRGQELSDVEIGLITPSDDVRKAMVTGVNAVNGENYLIPEDVSTEINTLRRTYISAKDLISVFPTESLSGSFVFEGGVPTGLVSFSDGGNVPDGAEPTVEQKKWNIGLYGAFIPVSNILTLAERASLMAYLNVWFIRNAIITENIRIFETLKAGKTPISLDGVAGLKTSINVDIDPSCKLTGSIVTNQSGFNYLDNQLDGMGRSILQPNPANSTDKVFQDMPVKVFTDALLPDVGGAHPIFYGNLKDGCWFIEFMSLVIAMSSHSGFRKNQTEIRVIEGFDVLGADKDAYQYGLLNEVVTP